MRFIESNWMDVEAYLQQDNRVILVLGATEQHAYLSLLSDVLTPEHIAIAMAELDPVLIAPPLNFGVSDRFSEYPGTISLSPQTFEQVLMDIIESLLHQGFSRFFILNGNKGNHTPARLNELQLDGLLRFVWYEWWRSDVVAAFEKEHELQVMHGNWGENFPFNRIAPSPVAFKSSVQEVYIEPGDSLREVLGDGNYGGPYQVSDGLMQDLFERVVRDAVGLLAAL